MPYFHPFEVYLFSWLTPLKIAHSTTDCSPSLYTEKGLGDEVLVLIFIFEYDVIS